jgi:hypothetical protein
MSTVKALYGTSNQTITCTLTSLGSGSAQQSTAVSNATNLYLDVLVFVQVKTNSSGTSTTGSVLVYAYGTADGGTTYSDGMTGSNGSATPTNPPNLPLLGVINTVANAATYDGGPFSLRAAFNGVLPDHWGIVVVNNSGAALDASVGGAWYQGYQEQIA